MSIVMIYGSLKLLKPSGPVQAVQGLFNFKRYSIGCRIVERVQDSVMAAG
jgi:hypothetical protein